MTLNEFNNLSEQDAANSLEKCCVSKTWIDTMIQNMPFTSTDKMLQKTANIWYNTCLEADWIEAFQGHPKIGNVNSLKEKFANTTAWATNEQAKIAEADEITIQELTIANSLYEEKYGYIFIVSATGKSANDMLSIIKTRLHNNKGDEIYVAMNEQHKITVIRLVKLIEEFSNNADMSSHITTHALDTSTGIPANEMLITLKGIRDDQWKPISTGITNTDGRIADVLPAGYKIPSGTYVMIFNTLNYYESHNQKGFYPEVSIQFTVRDKSHYHIPLLINPFGYTTYRGS